MIRRTTNSEQPEKAPSGLDCADQCGRAAACGVVLDTQASPSGQRVLQHMWRGAGYAGALLRGNKEKHGIFAAVVI